MSKKKVLLMGKSGAGKTSMRSIIFANYIARDTRRLGATMEVEHSHVRFLGNMTLNLWDCGGQEVFMENYIASQRDHIFRNVEVLIYVFDVESKEVDKDLKYYKSCVEAIHQFSPEAKLFCLIHKMDRVSTDQREILLDERDSVLKELSQPMKISTFGTSIWEETLYKAWSAIVYSLIPNIHILERNLEAFSKVCDADEVVLFERTTFLVISHTTVREHVDPHRFEKVSNIIKQFKLCCSKSQSQFKSMELCTPDFSVFIDVLTPNTYVMVVITDSTIQPASTLINIAAARKHFEKIELQSHQSSVIVMVESSWNDPSLLLAPTLPSQAKSLRYSKKHPEKVKLQRANQLFQYIEKEEKKEKLRKAAELTEICKLQREKINKQSDKIQKDRESHERDIEIGRRKDLSERRKKLISISKKVAEQKTGKKQPQIKPGKTTFAQLVSFIVVTQSLTKKASESTKTTKSIRSKPSSASTVGGKVPRSQFLRSINQRKRSPVRFPSGKVPTIETETFKSHFYKEQARDLKNLRRVLTVVPPIKRKERSVYSQKLRNDSEKLNLRSVERKESKKLKDDGPEATFRSDREFLEFKAKYANITDVEKPEILESFDKIKIKANENYLKKQMMYSIVSRNRIKTKLLTTDSINKPENENAKEKETQSDHVSDNHSTFFRSHLKHNPTDFNSSLERQNLEPSSYDSEYTVGADIIRWDSDSTETTKTFKVIKKVTYDENSLSDVKPKAEKDVHTRSVSFYTKDFKKQYGLLSAVAKSEGDYEEVGRLRQLENRQILKKSVNFFNHGNLRTLTSAGSQSELPVVAETSTANDTETLMFKNKQEKTETVRAPRWGDETDIRRKNWQPLSLSAVSETKSTKIPSKYLQVSLQDDKTSVYEALNANMRNYPSQLHASLPKEDNFEFSADKSNAGIKARLISSPMEKRKGLYITDNNPLLERQLEQDVGDKITAKNNIKMMNVVLQTGIQRTAKFLTLHMISLVYNKFATYFENPNDSDVADFEEDAVEEAIEPAEVEEKVTATKHSDDIPAILSRLQALEEQISSINEKLSNPSFYMGSLAPASVPLPVPTLNA
ncbi:hypothetical protein HK098_005493, partial [Nowakowskiella sp. JEL0407]